jgi:hypothetical protein
MSFRDDGDALRNRVESLEDELARTKDEAERLREERDRALGVPRMPELDVRHGAKLWVEWRGAWWPATAVREADHGMTRIHYDGFSTRWDEDVPASRMAPRDRPPPGKRAGLAPSGLAWVAVVLVVLGGLVAVALGSTSATSGTTPGTALVTARTLGVGSEVWIAWGSSWYEGRVIEIEGETSVRVHYTGWSDASDETVPIDRVRQR